jgi:hypothetical protein
MDVPGRAGMSDMGFHAARRRSGFPGLLSIARRRGGPMLVACGNLQRVLFQAMVACFPCGPPGRRVGQDVRLGRENGMSESSIRPTFRSRRLLSGSLLGSRQRSDDRMCQSSSVNNLLAEKSGVNRVGRLIRVPGRLIRRCVQLTLPRLRERLHSAVPDGFGCARGSEKFDQSFGRFHLARARHDGG